MLAKILGVAVVLALLLTFISFPTEAATQAQIETSVEKGITWLVAQQNADGDWDGYVAMTGFAVLKLEDRAFETGYNGPFDPLYPYKSNVEKGLNFIFASASTVSIAAQPAGNPDASGDGIGVYFTGYEGTSYDTGIAMMAIAASRAPGNVVNVPTSPVNGWTYKAVLQDMVDYFAWGQTDDYITGGNVYRGGWYYGPNSGSSDNSNSGYVVVGLSYVQPAIYGFNCIIPAFVRSELDFWITYIQSADGGSGYTEPGYWENTLKTGNLLAQMAFFGDNSGVIRVTNAVNYIGAHWYDTSLVQGWGWNQPSGPAVAQYQAAYSLMKGLQTMGIPDNGVSGVANWFQDLANVIVPQQNVDGSWPASYAFWWFDNSGGDLVDSILSTEWALLTLEKISPPPRLSLSPETATNYTGTTHTLTANLTESNGDPIPGVKITFNITSGPDAGLTGTGTTNASGQATWSYPGTKAGTDTIIASGGDVTSLEVHKIWILPPVGTLEILKYEDYNQDGGREADEPVLAGWGFSISTFDGFNFSGKTNSAGILIVPNLRPGTYIVTERETGVDASGGAWYSTTGNPRKVVIEGGKVTRVEFGNAYNPHVPATSNIGLLVMILGMAALMIVFVLRRTRRVS